MDGFKVQLGFPAILTPAIGLDNDSFLQYIIQNKQEIQKLLLKYGALLFRGFPVNTVAAFSKFIQTLNFGNFVDYIGGDSPRDKVEHGVYTSTEAPPSIHIPLHQELSFIKYHPKHIYFYCETPPTSGGETIIADARQVYHSLNKNILQKFSEKKITYISHYYYKSKIMELLNRYQRSHKSWIDVFETIDKAEVEKKCIENEFSWRWLKQDWLQIKQTRPSTHIHPETKEVVWFNQAHLYDFNPRLLGLKRYIGAKLFYFRKMTRLHEVEFADGTTIPRKDLYHILDTLQKNTVAFPWHKRDVLVLDNILAMHGRAPFNSKRRILTALTS